MLVLFERQLVFLRDAEQLFPCGLDERRVRSLCQVVLRLLAFLLEKGDDLVGERDLCGERLFRLVSLTDFCECLLQKGGEIIREDGRCFGRVDGAFVFSPRGERVEELREAVADDLFVDAGRQGIFHGRHLF